MYVYIYKKEYESKKEGTKIRYDTNMNMVDFEVVGHVPIDPH